MMRDWSFGLFTCKSAIASIWAPTPLQTEQHMRVWMSNGLQEHFLPLFINSGSKSRRERTDPAPFITSNRTVQKVHRLLSLLMKKAAGSRAKHRDAYLPGGWLDSTRAHTQKHTFSKNTHTHTDMLSHTHTHWQTCTCTHAHTHTYSHTRSHKHAHTKTLQQKCTHTHTRRHTHTLTDIHTLMHMHTLSQTCTRTNTHKTL